MLTAIDATEPTPICMAPSMEAALPALPEKGASDKAPALGLTKPTQIRKRKIKNMICDNPYQPAALPARKMMDTEACARMAARVICPLVYFFNSREFTWLNPIKPIERKAKIHP